MNSNVRNFSVDKKNRKKPSNKVVNIIKADDLIGHSKGAIGLALEKQIQQQMNKSNQDSGLKKHERNSMTEKKGQGPSRKGSRIKHHNKGLYSARMNNSIECVKKGEISSLKPDRVINESIYDCDDKSCSEDDQKNQ